MKRTMILALVLLTLMMQATGAMAASKTGTVTGPDTVQFDNFAMEFVSAKFTDTSAEMQLNILFDEYVYQLVGYTFTMQFDEPWYAPFTYTCMTHVMGEDPDELAIDFTDARFDWWTDEAGQRSDGKWVYPVQLKTTGCKVNAQDVWTLRFSLYDADTEMFSPMEDNGEIEVDFR